MRSFNRLENARLKGKFRKRPQNEPLPAEGIKPWVPEKSATALEGARTKAAEAKVGDSPGVTLEVRDKPAEADNVATSNADNASAA